MPRRRSSWRAPSCNDNYRGGTRPRMSSVSSSPESSRSSRSSDRDRSKQDSEENNHRRRRGSKKSSPSEVISSACRYTQAEVTPGNRGVFAAVYRRQLHVDFDIEHQVWHLVPPTTTTTTTIASEGTSIAVPEKRRGRQIEGPRAVECSSSTNEAHSSGSHATTGETTALSENHDLVKAADSKCRIDGDAGSREVPGGLQQPAGDGERVDECTPAQRGLPSKEETVTPANEQAGAATTSGSTSFPADEETGGPTEVMLNRDTEGEPLLHISKVLEVDATTPTDNMNQPDTVEHNNAGTTGDDGGRETEAGTQQASPKEGVRESFAAEPKNYEGVSKDPHGTTSLQAEPIALDAEKSERNDDSDSHEAITRDGRHFTGSGVAQEAEEEGREAVDGGKRKEEGGNEQGEEPERSRRVGGATAQGSINNSNEAASKHKVRFDQPATFEEETHNIRARRVGMPADAGGDSVEKRCDRLMHGGDGDDESPGQQREAAPQVTWRGETVLLAKDIVITIRGSRLGQPQPERQGQGERESHPRGREPIITDGRNKQRKGYSRNLAAKDPVTDALFSDEGSDERSPAQQGEGKTSSESRAGGRFDGNTDCPGGKRTSPSPSHAPRSAGDGEEQAKRVGERRRSNTEASPAKKHSSEAKGEAAGRAFLRSDGDNLQRPCRRQRSREEALPATRSGSPPSPTSSRGHGGRGSAGHGRALSRLSRPVFFLADPYLGPPVASCPRAWPCGSNVMVDSTVDCGRHRRRHRGRHHRRRRHVSNSHGSDTSRKARRRFESRERAAGGGGLRSRSSEQKDSSPFNRRSQSATSSSSSSSSSSKSRNNSSSSNSASRSGNSSTSSSGVFSGVERKKGERPAEAKRGRTARNREERTSEERRPQRSSRRGSNQRTSTIGEEKGG